MKTSFKRLMKDALHMTHGGDLRAATAAIQAALGGAGPSVSMRQQPEGDVIDMEVDEPSPATSTDPASFSSGHYGLGANVRDYKLYTPPQAGSRPLPLVVMLHGCTQHPEDFARGTEMNEAAAEDGFFVLYPAQSQAANPSRCWNWFKHNHQGRGRGEPALLAGMTREIVERHPIDPARVYVAGLSAGGAMAAILGDAYPELFAAVGVHSGLPPGAASDVNGALNAMKDGAAPAADRLRSPPTIVFHGDHDSTVHPDNGEQLAAASAAGLGAAEVSSRSANGRTFTRRVWRDDSGRVQAEHWLVHGASHAWSGGSPQGSFADARGPSATREMLRFFFDRTKA